MPVLLPTGLAWLFLGVANKDSLLYDDEFQEVLKSYPDNFRVSYALSREQVRWPPPRPLLQEEREREAEQQFVHRDQTLPCLRPPGVESVVYDSTCVPYTQPGCGS